MAWIDQHELERGSSHRGRQKRCRCGRTRGRGRPRLFAGWSGYSEGLYAKKRTAYMVYDRARVVTHTQTTVA
jgi:hypothetical protein